MCIISFEVIRVFGKMCPEFQLASFHVHLSFDLCLWFIICIFSSKFSFDFCSHFILFSISTTLEKWVKTESFPKRGRKHSPGAISRSFAKRNRWRKTWRVTWTGFARPNSWTVQTLDSARTPRYAQTHSLVVWKNWLGNWGNLEPMMQ